MLVVFSVRSLASIDLSSSISEDTRLRSRLLATWRSVSLRLCNCCSTVASRLSCLMAARRSLFNRRCNCFVSVTSAPLRLLLVAPSSWKTGSSRRICGLAVWKSSSGTTAPGLPALPRQSSPNEASGPDNRVCRAPARPLPSMRSSAGLTSSYAATRAAEASASASARTTSASTPMTASAASTHCSRPALAEETQDSKRATPSWKKDEQKRQAGRTNS
mmetsp:Transcript_84436/g.188602  ORF Transcript_84436/g.188602 Transcript_84436/m.188602 type:complete len:218 (+) Transcript_84436:116-769(+)